ncbi:MAG: alpha-mannosidase, partial [Bacteroidetes bacterium]|nr:alpha-mannosidase [Bacteroidota bacterium]
MRTMLIALVLLPALLFAQSPVDRLASTLDSLATVSFDAWMMSPDLKTAKLEGTDPTAPGFDDSKWETLKLDQRAYSDSCWLRKLVVLPDRIMGEPVQGRIRILLTLDDYGSLWVNGEPRGKFLWDGSFVLTEEARPGDRFMLAIRAVNTGGPLRLLRAELEMESTRTIAKTMKDFAVSIRVGQRLLSFDTYQVNAYSGQKEDPGIDKSTIARTERQELNAMLQQVASSVDYAAIRRGEVKPLLASLETMRPRLSPVAAFAKRFTLTLTSNAHIDAAWLWREAETKLVARNTFTSVLNMMDARPDFTYSQSAAQYYEWMEKSYPDVFNRIRERVRDKRWEITGGMWIEPDCNLPAGESWMRQFLFAQQYFKKTFGFMPRLGWNPDSFGYMWNMPQFFLNA